MADERTPEEIAAGQKAAADTAAKLERLASIEAENKELIAQRDKAKQKAREAEEAKLAENEEFRTLAEQRKIDLDALAKEKAALEAERDQYRVRDEARLKTLIDAMPEAQRKLIKENFSLSDKIELAESLVALKPSAPGTRLPGEIHETLQGKYAEATKSADVMGMIGLKLQMADPRKN